jgi:hypothetical protein
MRDILQTTLRGMLSISLIGALLLGFAVQSSAQVTTSSMSGKISDEKGEALIGATVVAVHTPSGTRYGTTTNVDGTFYFSSMRPGGPYKVDVTYTGYASLTAENITLLLGQTFVFNQTLNETAVDLTGVEVYATRSNILNSNRTGAATNISSDQINSLPTISRSINDYVRLTPQAQAGNGFAGRDGRYNNVQIDGANFNNNFGLSSSSLPGGGSQPISLDAIEEIQVNVAPYDVRQTNFTGAGINAVTRSGTNTLKGSAYYFFRNQNFIGTKVAGDTVPALPESNSKTIGARLSGPIIKDKLFFFVNAEVEDNVRPGINLVPTAPGRTGDNLSRTTVQDMTTVQSFLRDTYGYDPGAIENYANNFRTANYKALARIDWNINDNHKFSVRYNQMVATDDQTVNGSSAPNPRSSSNRISRNSYAFEFANYGFENSVRSLAAELNSSFNNKISNQLLVTYTRIQDRRTSGSTPFPFVDIKKDGDAYMSFGYELFSWKNDVINNVTTITDNLSINLGKHNITAGASFDFLSFGNSFQRYGTSYYRYESMEQFLNNQAPSAFALTYSFLPDGADPYAELDFGLGGLYVQDEYRVSDKFKLTAGVRLDMPFYFNDLISNPAVSALTFKDETGLNDVKLDVGQWPKSRLLVSPRVGFYYDITGDRKLQLRGGTGIFTGRIPFVWFTNQPTNSGMLQNTVELVGAAVTNAGITSFNPDPRAYVGNFPQNAGTSAPGSIAAIDSEFKMPQIWRSNLAFDAQLPGGLVVSLEGLYSKDIVAIYQYNANQLAPVGAMNAYNGLDTRPFFGASNTLRRANPSMSEAMVLSNTNRGNSMALTASVSKEFTKGLFASLAYTYTEANEVTSNPGSQAASAWSNNLSVRGHNDLDLAPSQFAVPHRVMGAFSYRFEYLNALATTVSLFWEGSHQGRYSYRYSSDFNRDGINADLLFIPNNPQDMVFTNVTGFTADQQRDAFFRFIDQDKYLSANKGSYAQRNGALRPWRNQWDFRLLQDVFTNIGNKRNSLQLSIDILNVGNMINSDWGIVQNLAYPNGSILTPSVAADGTATFQMPRVGGQLLDSSFVNLIGTASTWSMQMGLRYIF